MKRRRIKQTLSLEERLTQAAKQFRAQAKLLHVERFARHWSGRLAKRRRALA